MLSGSWALMGSVRQFLGAVLWGVGFPVVLTAGGLQMRDGEPGSALPVLWGQAWSSFIPACPSLQHGQKELTCSGGGSALSGLHRCLAGSGTPGRVRGLQNRRVRLVGGM